jgi:hypothetical protein
MNPIEECRLPVHPLVKGFKAEGQAKHLSFYFFYSTLYYIFVHLICRLTIYVSHGVSKTYLLLLQYGLLLLMFNTPILLYFLNKQVLNSWIQQQK